MAAWKSQRAKFYCVILTLTTLQFVGSVSYGDVVITQEGKPVAQIIRLGDLDASEAYAVEELVTYVQKISGATLPILTVARLEDLPVDTKVSRIFLGHATCQTLFPELSLDGLGDEGFIIQTNGKDIVIAGGRLRGTLYGVYTFLEEYLGVRWWSPLDTDIPTKPTIRLGEINDRQVPRLELRDAMYCQWEFAMAGFQWNARNKINGMSNDTLADPKYRKLGGSYFTNFVGRMGHNQHHLVTSAGIDFEPEMLALTTSGQRARLQPCSTHPKVIQATAKSIIELYRKNPNTPYVNIAHEDNMNYCTCERCASIDAEEGSHMGQLLFLVNRVAQELEKEFPQGRIMVSAYQWSWKPPRKMRLRHNVIIRLAPIQLNQFYPIHASQDEANQEIETTFTEWGKISPVNFVWTYTTNFRHYNAPWPNLDGMLENIDFFVAHNARGIVCQGAHTSPGSEFHALRTWTLARKMWNPDLDNVKLYNTFIEGYYGPAAEYVQQYIQTLHDQVRSEDYPPSITMPLNQDFLRPEVVADLEAIARKAEQAVAGKEPFERRVRHFHMPLWYVLLQRGPGSNTWKAVESKVGDIELVDVVENFSQVAQENKIRALSEWEINTVDKFIKWGQQYAVLVKEQGTHVLAAEARADENLTVFRQAWQLGDGPMKDRNRQMDEQATDGWAINVHSTGWLIRYMFSRFEDMTPEKTYKLHVRVRGGEVPSGFSFGIGGTKNVSSDVALGNVTKQYAVYTSPAFKAVEQRMNFFIALSKDRPENASILLDCLWVSQVPSEP